MELKLLLYCIDMLHRKNTMYAYAVIYIYIYSAHTYTHIRDARDPALTSRSLQGRKNPFDLLAAAHCRVLQLTAKQETAGHGFAPNLGPSGGFPGGLPLKQPNGELKLKSWWVSWWFAFKQPNGCQKERTRSPASDGFPGGLPLKQPNGELKLKSGNLTSGWPPKGHTHMALQENGSPTAPKSTYITT